MANSKSKRSTDLRELLATRLAPYIESGQRICVSLSGGVDSVVLLHVTVAVTGTINARPPVALHVHHGLSPNADSWTSFCRGLCAKVGVALDVRRVDVHPDGEGIEAAARKARYAVLDAVDADWILLGHHRDDQAEGMLLNLLRGSGIHGAAGMADRRGRYLRPLLEVSREDIVKYAAENGLSWVEDESNTETRYRRNFLRQRVIPLLHGAFPQAPASLAHAARAFRDAAELLDEVARGDLGGAARLKVSQLKSLSPARAANLLSYYLRQKGLQIPSSALLREMLRQLMTTGSDNSILFALGKYEVRRFREEVFVDLPTEPVSPVAWRGGDSIGWGRHRINLRQVVGDGVAEVACRTPPSLFFAPRRGGEMLQLKPDRPHRPLKDLWREAGIPPWHRNTLPVLYAGNEVVWAAAVGVTAKYRCTPGAAGISIEFDGVTW